MSVPNQTIHRLEQQLETQAAIVQEQQARIEVLEDQASAVAAMLQKYQSHFDELETTKELKYKPKSRQSDTSARDAACGKAEDTTKKSHFSTAELLSGGYSTGELMQAGWDARELRSAGASLEDFVGKGRQPACAGRVLYHAGFSLSELRNGGCPVEALREAGHSWAELRAAGFCACCCGRAGALLQDLCACGFPVSDLRGMGYSLGDLLTVAKDKDSLSVTEWRERRVSPRRLRELGFGVSQVVVAESWSWETIDEVLGAGFTYQEWHAAQGEHPLVKHMQAQLPVTLAKFLENRWGWFGTSIDWANFRGDGPEDSQGAGLPGMEASPLCPPLLPLLRKSKHDCQTCDSFNRRAWPHETRGIGMQPDVWTTRDVLNFDTFRQTAHAG
eukprot:CAMPEP_0204347410 /NCGR_PEP_ID=MMETSP0469-20131031/27931_1 /ASSEMBLY_ACC=CAM_ASM_000384 /TAXON_ID=2969 /ORGANISM="Oxyrrhis marina" /LENGTH=387 /DNA_ID=CAMNT_0051333213 /DNA_START=18 /DNA_END=1177 /DNA_ORIENTATION=-